MPLSRPSWAPTPHLGVVDVFTDPGPTDGHVLSSWPFLFRLRALQPLLVRGGLMLGSSIQWERTSKFREGKPVPQELGS